MIKSLSVLLAIAGIISAANITFTSAEQCGGLGLYGARKVDEIPCYDISTYDSAMSIMLEDIVNQTITFFSDVACNTPIARASDDSCVTFAGASVNSFSLVKNNGTSLARSLETRDNASNSTDLVPYGVKLSSYKGLAQTSPYNIDL